MSKNVTQFTILALLVSCGLSGCGGGAASNAIRKATRTVVSDEYAFEHNGCSTGKHKFDGSSKVEVLNKKCEALQDPVRNKSCAEFQRKAEFEKICKGPWVQTNPPIDSSVKTAPGDEVLAAPVSILSQGGLLADVQLDPQLDLQLQSSLHRLTEKSLVARVVEKDLAKSEDKDYFGGFIKKLEMCSLNAMGSACYDSSSDGIREALLQNSANYSYVVELQRAGGNLTPVILIFEVIGDLEQGRFDEKKAAVKSVKVLQSLVNPRRQSLVEYIQKPGNFREIAHIEIAARGAVNDLIKSKLAKPSSLREFIHMLKLSEQNSAVFLGAVIKNNPDLILKSQDSLYQQHFVSLLLENTSVNSAEVSTLMTQLLNSGNSDVQKATGAFLFQESPENLELRRWALEALDHPLWQIRRAAVIGLSKVELNKEEENLILSLLGDVAEVKDLVRTWATEKLQLTAENVSVLQNVLATSPQSQVDVFSLLKKIDDISATRVLILMLEGDGNKMTRKLYEELNRRSMAPDLRFELKKIIEESKNSEDARVYAVRLLAKIASDESRKDLQELQQKVSLLSLKEEIEIALK